ncbi:MAG: alpha/beta hydrolase [Chitinophagales bacterium]|nr:T9SS type A sorting domain-containing protein [Bacteroidota bacterium]MCB9042681.1 T9SS type A sorting domain-containing protein [Chitinophagales bacterium]
MKLLKLLLLSLLFAPTALAQTFSIGNTSLTLSDGTNSVSTQIYYPANTTGTNVSVAAGTFPVVIFGHGFSIAYSSYSQVWETLVPEGFIVVLPTTQSGLSPNHAQFGVDLNTAAYGMQNQNTLSGSLFEGKVAPFTAIGGHSMGGGAAFLAAAANTTLTCMFTFAAAETNPSAIAAAANINIPNLVISGTEDCVAPTNTHQIPMYNATASSCKVYYEIEGASHCQFTNGNATNCYLGEGFSCFGWGPFISLSEQHSMVNNAILPWLRFWLKNECVQWSAFNNYIANANGFIYQSPDLSCGYDISDLDNDGIVAMCDNCPDTANPLQEDSDQNGIGDVCEACLADISVVADISAGQSTDYSATNSIVVQNHIFPNGSSQMQAGNFIQLENTFWAESASFFEAVIAPCSNKTAAFSQIPAMDLAITKVYPNPFSNNLFVENLSPEASVIRLTSITGQLVFQQSINSEEANSSWNINVDCPQSVLLLTIFKANGEIIMKKLLVHLP